MIWSAGILAVIAGCYVLWQYWELKKFGVTSYEIPTEKLKEEHRFVVLADLHGFTYGKGNSRLISRIRALKPQFILIAGDMIVSRDPDSYERALDTLKQLIAVAPVYYGFGNHESRAAKRRVYVYFDFQKYRKAAEELGVCFLRNENRKVRIGEDELFLAGLELSLDYYLRTDVPMGDSCVFEYLGEAAEGFQMLLAHNPAYSEKYAAWGADLTFCGHNHGGLIRLPGIGSLISPQLTLFPKYNDGCHEIQNKRVIISRGLGTHTFHIRIFNRAELISVKLLPNVLEKESGNRYNET